MKEKRKNTRKLIFIDYEEVHKNWQNKSRKELKEIHSKIKNNRDYYWDRQDSYKNCNDNCHNCLKEECAYKKKCALEREMMNLVYYIECKGSEGKEERK